MHMTTVNVNWTLDYLNGIATEHGTHRPSEKQVFTYIPPMLY